MKRLRIRAGGFYYSRGFAALSRAPYARFCGFAAQRAPDKTAIMQATKHTARYSEFAITSVVCKVAENILRSIVTGSKPTDAIFSGPIKGI